MSAWFAKSEFKTAGKHGGGQTRIDLRVMRSPTGCEEKTRLLAEYETATKRFSEAVTETQRKMGTSAKSEYERLNRASEDARARSDRGRIALEQHIEAHGC
jgi:hypothetical protein